MNFRLKMALFASSFFALLVFTLTPAHASSERRSQRIEPEVTGETVVFEWEGGSWRYQGVQGTYRFVVTESMITESNKLYLQWWRDAAQGRELANSVSVKELNTVPSHRFSSVSCVNEACDKLAFEIEHSYERYRQKALIKLTGLGFYTLQFE